MFRRYAYTFPIILTLLTVLLILFMVRTVNPEKSLEGYVVKEEIEEVTSEGYEQHIGEIVESFSFAYSEAETDLMKSVLVETTLNDVLAVRVPAGYQSVHLDFVFGLNSLREALDGEGDVQDAYDSIQVFIDQTSWVLDSTNQQEERVND